MELDKIRKVVKFALIKIGIRCDLVGFNYLCLAVELVILKPDLIHKLCKGLYAEVGKTFNVSKQNCVERDIRHAIENTYINKDFTELNKMFHTQIYTVQDKPTAGELIRLVAEYYNLGLYKEYAELINLPA
ncbi:MAG: sporulation initiation factor Spo0A C-terminal domain-containing protein [Candidatus Caccovivens sp.]